MKADNSILLEIYCDDYIDRDLFDVIVRWMEEARALKTVDGEKHVNFPKYNDFILKFLDKEKEQVQDKDSAFRYWAVAADFFSTRYNFIYQLRHKFLCEKDADLAELRRQFKVVSPKFKEIAERYVLACELRLDLKSKEPKSKITRKEAKRKQK